MLINVSKKSSFKFSLNKLMSTRKPPPRTNPPFFIYMQLSIILPRAQRIRRPSFHRSRSPLPCPVCLKLFQVSTDFDDFRLFHLLIYPIDQDFIPTSSTSRSIPHSYTWSSINLLPSPFIYSSINLPPHFIQSLINLPFRVYSSIHFPFFHT